MNELYEAIEKKIKSSGYPRLISGEDIFYFPNLMMMSCLNIISRFRMMILILES